MAHLDLDTETMKLSNRIRQALVDHIDKFHEGEYQEIITTCLVSLASEAGRLRWLCDASGEVALKRFDKIFWEVLENHYQVNKDKFGTTN